jgi:hypothetical protein
MKYSATFFRTLFVGLLVQSLILSDLSAQSFPDEELLPTRGGPVTEAGKDWDNFWDLSVPTNGAIVWAKKVEYKIYLTWDDWNYSRNRTNEEIDLQVELFGLAWVESFNLNLTDQLKPEDIFKYYLQSLGQ